LRGGPFAAYERYQVRGKHPNDAFDAAIGKCDERRFIKGVFAADRGHENVSTLALKEVETGGENITSGDAGTVRERGTSGKE
jgi:hypothetical protein